MKYYCKNCGSIFEPGVLINGIYNCPMCKKEMQPIPDYETPQMYEKRTGKAWPDDGLVFFNYKNSGNGKEVWASDNYDYAKWYASNNLKNECVIVIADPPVPPPDGWRPEELGGEYDL
jgi:hypothetical protein